MKILELDRNPDAGINDLIAIVELDPAIAAQIVKFANSPISGLSREITSFRPAATLVGMRVAKTIALSFSLLKSRCEGTDLNIEDFWQRSIGIGVTARFLSKGENADPDTAFITGLLSRLGWLMVQTADPKSFKQIVDSAKTDSEIQSNAKEVYERSLYEIGADTLQEWGFPEDIYGVINQVEESDSSEDQRVKILALSQCMTELLNESELAISVSDCRMHFLDLCSNDELTFEECYEQISEQYAEYLQLVELPVPSFRECWEVEQQARQALAEMTLQGELERRKLENENEKLVCEAQTDRLTGLRNRRAFELRATEEVDRSQRNGRELGMLVVDIDKFKTFNDTHGHLVGDAVLREVGQCMDSVIRKYDSIFRYGGEEFVGLVPECGLTDVLSVAERIRSEVESLRVEFEGQTLAVTISVGVAFVDGSRATSWNQMFEDADRELYRAKQNGRNQVSVAQASSAV